MIKGLWRINDVYTPYINDQTRTQIFFGGSSSGKSRFIAQRLVYDILGGKRNYLIVRNTAKTNRSTTYNEINTVISEWNVEKYFKINKSEMTITCPSANNRQALFVGLDDVEKIKGIKPENRDIITDLWLEEATEMNEDDYRQLTKRLRGISNVPKRITLSFNPIMRTHWIFKEFFTHFRDTDTEYRDPELSILKTTYKDNRFLAPEDSHFLESEKNEYYYNVYTLGQWGVLGDLVFTNWHTEDLSKIKNVFAAYNNGLDFGYTNDPTALCRCAIKGKKLYITHALYEYGLTNDAIGRLVLPIVGKDVLRCDPSEPKSIQELRGLGLTGAIAARGGKGSVNHGIQFIQQHEVIIERTLQDAINEFQLYQWERNKDGQAMNTPTDKNNHFIDALRYALSGISFAAKKPEGTFDRRSLGLPV